MKFPIINLLMNFGISLIFWGLSRAQPQVQIDADSVEDWSISIDQRSYSSCDMEQLNNTVNELKGLYNNMISIQGVSKLKSPSTAFMEIIFKVSAIV